MKWKITVLFIFCISHNFAQINIKGKVTDNKGQAVFAANVYIQSQPQQGTATDIDGNFHLKTKDSNGLLVVSFIGYKTKKINLTDKLTQKDKMVIVLEEDNQTLDEVIIKARDPISEKFSVTKIKKLDIYFNPMAQGDALKAITLLPASTTIDETANPSLRGSSPDRTRVILNGVPIYTPVRSSQLNNQGFFSLFSTEVIDNQYVYASNPPLIYGNSSAGLVEIQTLKHLPENQQQFSLSIGAVGFFLSQKIKDNDKNFIQLYGNYNDSKAFIGIQKKNLPYLNYFNTKDIGLNLHLKISDNMDFNSYNYMVGEEFNVNVNNLNYSGVANAGKVRFFSVNNLNYYTTKGVLNVNTGISRSNQDFNFGSIQSNKEVQQVYTSVNFKSRITKLLSLQTGISYDYQKNQFHDSIPKYPFALAPTAPKRLSKEQISNQMADIYAYGYYTLSDKLSFSVGLRTNIPIEEQTQHLNAQFGTNFHIDDKQSIMMSIGNYKTYATPNFYNKKFTSLSSKQFAVDYSIIRKKIGFKSAIYYKQETGKQLLNYYVSIDKINTFGVELYLQYLLTNHLKFTLSNSFINQKLKQKEKEFPGKYDFNYLTKLALQYTTLKWGAISLSYITHPGNYYTPINEIIHKPGFQYLIPIFSNEINSEQLKPYHKVDFGYSRYTSLKNGGSIIPFLSITNIFNFENEKAVYYSNDYSEKHYENYGNRVIYFGVIWEL